MSTPSPRDVERLLESLADQEPPSDLLERLDADVPEVLPTADVEPPATLPVWRRRPLAVAALGLAAAVLVAFGLARLAEHRQRPTVDAEVQEQLTQWRANAQALQEQVSHDRAESAPLRRELPTSQRAPAAVPPSDSSLRRTWRSGAANDPNAAVLESQFCPPSAPTRQAAAPARPALAAPAPPTTTATTGHAASGGSPGVTVTAATGARLQAVMPSPSRQVPVSPNAGADIDPNEFPFKTQEVTVVGAAPTVDTRSTQVATSHEKQLVQALPAAASYGAFVAPTPRPGATAISGCASYENLYIVNGVAAVDPRKANELLVIEAKDKKDGYARTAAVDDREVAPGGARPRTALQARKASGETLGELPLEHTDVRADIAGFMARTVVTQRYGNPFREPIEAVYVFPLGATAAVNDFVMEVGDRRIVGVVRPREEAERIYQEARERGQTASLLTQERPNIFTQNVANIAPGKTVDITITTFETLQADRGTFEYVFPMAVGPRYIPGAPAATPQRASGGGGWSGSTRVVPDADRITPPVLKPGERSGHDIGLAVLLDAGMAVAEVRSPSHEVEVRTHGPNRRSIELVGADTIPNRDFVLRWRVAPERIATGTLTYRDREQGFLALLVQPPLQPPDELVSPREITFVLDVSGSMAGVPVETSKALVRRVLGGLRPSDAFNIVLFASGNGQLWPEPRPWSEANVAEARAFVDRLAGGGGTEMLAGLERAVGAAHDPARLQMYVFCTDGFVGDEERILAFVGTERRDARFFAFGIGSSVNRYLIDGIGRLGAGSSMVVLPRDAEAAEHAADRFFTLIDAPVLVDAALDWNGLPVTDVYPARLGDLFTGSAFTVVARYTKPASGTAYLTGRLGTRTVRIPIAVELPRRAPEHAELAPVWARHRIAELSDELLTAPAERAAELKATITDLAVEFRLASQFTAFVAVDESEVTGKGRPRRVDQAVPMPEDVRHDTVFGPPR